MFTLFCELLLEIIEVILKPKYDPLWGKIANFPYQFIRYIKEESTALLVGWKYILVDVSLSDKIFANPSGVTKNMIENNIKFYDFNDGKFVSDKLVDDHPMRPEQIFKKFKNPQIYNYIMSLPDKKKHTLIGDMTLTSGAPKKVNDNDVKKGGVKYSNFNTRHAYRHLIDSGKYVLLRFPCKNSGKKLVVTYTQPEKVDEIIVSPETEEFERLMGRVDN